MRLSWLTLAICCLTLACSEKKHPVPAGSATTKPKAPATASGGMKTDRDWEAISTVRKADEWPMYGRYERELEHDGNKRRYLVQIPPTYKKGKKAPLLLMLHGGGGLPEQYAREGLGISLMAARNGWLAVFPQGSQKHPEKKGYAWSHGLCFADGREKIDEVGFFRALIAQMSKDIDVDGRRIYVMGFSSGGRMAHVLGAEMGDLLAGIVPIAGMNICQKKGGAKEQIKPTEPMNVLMIFGSKDPGLPIEGGPTEKTKGELITGSVEDMTKLWADFDKCPKPVKKGAKTDPALTFDHDCEETGKRVLTVISQRHGHEIPDRLGRKPTMRLVGRFLEGSFRPREEKKKEEEKKD